MLCYVCMLGMQCYAMQWNGCMYVWLVYRLYCRFNLQYIYIIHIYMYHTPSTIMPLLYGVSWNGWVTEVTMVVLTLNWPSDLDDVGVITSSLGNLHIYTYFFILYFCLFIIILYIMYYVLYSIFYIIFYLLYIIHYIFHIIFYMLYIIW